MGGTFNAKIGLVRSFSPDANTGNYAGTALLVTSIDILNDRGEAIGYIQQFSSQHSRPTTRIRHIGSADAGLTLEQAPSPEDITLNLTGFALYNNDINGGTGQNQGSIVQRLAVSENMIATFKSLSQQHYGFVIREVERNPATLQVVSAIEYQDCWLVNYSKPINMGTSTISETATANCSRVATYVMSTR